MIPDAEHPSSPTDTIEAEPGAPELLSVKPWPDPVIDSLGHDPRSQYVEQFWLGVLGPSTTWLIRRVAASFDAEPEGFDMPLRETARSLGLGMKDGRHSPFMRAIERACQFGLARRIDETTLVVRRYLPPVTQGQLRRLPATVQQSHAAWREAELTAGEAQAQQKARRLALTLLEIGEDAGAAERQLAAWRFQPHVAEQALQWAHQRHTAAQAAATATGPDAA